MELILASNNAGKIVEISALLPHLTLRTMREVGYTADIAEPFETFHQNAFQKARTIYDWCGKPTLADDSGLCADALGGAPGVYSARFAGIGASDEENNRKLILALATEHNRAAYYIAVLCLILNGEAHYFEGRCDGMIAYEPKGTAGFGYDPLFIPQGFTHTFGEIDKSIKSQISHRAKALSSLSWSGLLAG